MFLALCLLGFLLEMLPDAALRFSHQGLAGAGPVQPILGVLPSILMIDDGPQFVTLLVGFAALLTIPLCVGWFDRVAAVLIWYLLACLNWRYPVDGGQSVFLIGWLLLGHVIMPPRPRGALSARACPDGGLSWRMPWLLHAAAWFLLALTYTGAGLGKLSVEAHSASLHIGAAGALAPVLPVAVIGPLVWVTLLVELAFAPLALCRWLRPLLWGWTLIVHQVLIGSLYSGDANLGVLLLHLFCFDPAWIRPIAANTAEIVLYESRSRLAQRLVRFLLAEDWSGSAFRFATFQSATAQRSAANHSNQPLGTELSILTGDGKLLVKSAALLYAMHRLGGMWAILADLAALLPRVVRDVAYDGLARIGRRLGPAPRDAWAAFGAEVRDRFEP